MNESFTHISTNNITKLNWLIYAGAKLVNEKIDVLQKNTNRNSKPGWEITLEIQIRNLQQAKMKRQKLNAGTCWDERKKSNTSKTSNTTRGNKSEDTGERRKTKKISRQDKTIQKNQGIPKTTKKDSVSMLGENARRYTNNRMTRKQSNFGAR